MFALLVRQFGVSWRLIAAIAVGAAIIWVWRIYLTSTDPQFARLYNGLDTRSDALLVGCGLAWQLKLMPAGTYPAFERFLPKLAWPFIIFSILTTFFFVHSTHPFYYYVGIMIFGALPGALLVIMLLRSSGTV